jgi:methyl-accepting chemotaxis protein
MNEAAAQLNISMTEVSNIVESNTAAVEEMAASSIEVKTINRGRCISIE